MNASTKIERDLARALRKAEAEGNEDVATELLNEVCDLLNLPLDETEQGLTEDASRKIDHWITSLLDR